MKFVEVIPKTVQGEGKYAGSLMSIVRFSGCNHFCSFCDTEFNEEKVDIPTYNELISMVPMQRVMVTGGEPTIHPKFAAVVQSLISHGKEVHIETNGYDLDDWSSRLPGSVVWAVSPKFEASGIDYELSNYQGIKSIYDQRGGKIKDCFLKFVIGESYLDDLYEVEQLIVDLGVSIDDVWLQPVDNNLSIYREMIEVGPVRAHYGLQLHKVVGVK